MPSSTTTIVKIDHSDVAVKERLRQFLAPHEAHALFILGNLRSQRPAEVYAAGRDGQWVGLCAYYPTHKSMVPFAADAGVMRELATHVARLHPQIDYLTGVDYAAEPAYEVLLSLGYRATNDPRQVLLELDGQPPPQVAEPLCRAFRAEDAEQTVRVLRSLGDDEDLDADVRQDELDKIRLNMDRWVLVRDGAVVSTAATSGIGIRACQIIGVATHPAHRRRGYASAVCAHLIRQMAARGAERTVLFTGHANEAAIACYQRLGFRITGGFCVAKLKRP